MMGASVDQRKGRIIREMYDRLLAVYGPQHWWPARTALEVMVGAILVQNTNWSNVERAIGSLRKQGYLSWHRLCLLPESELADMIRPAGYFRIKARRLRNLLEFLATYEDGDMVRMSRRPVQVLRQALLGVNGIGPETADSILLYAFKKPAFVVDAYTRRLLERHRFPEWDAAYEVVQSLFRQHLPTDIQLYNEYHALIVRLGKEYKGPEAAFQDQYPLKEPDFFM